MSYWPDTYTSTDAVRERPPQCVEPVQEFRMSDGTTLRPGRDRLALSHEWVVSHPENFRLVDGFTRRTRAEFRAMLERAERMLERGQEPGRHLTRIRAPDPAEEDRKLGWGSGGLSLPPRPRPLRLPS
jgi:hypothetical protein